MPIGGGPFSIIEKLIDVTMSLDLHTTILSRGIHNAFYAQLLRPLYPRYYLR
jgi:hypothetical protein